jgi:hypothetical protein
MISLLPPPPRKTRSLFRRLSTNHGEAPTSTTAGCRVAASMVQISLEHRPLHPPTYASYSSPHSQTAQLAERGTLVPPANALKSPQVVAARPRILPRGFLLRFSNAGPECVARSMMRRRPKNLLSSGLQKCGDRPLLQVPIFVCRAASLSISDCTACAAWPANSFCWVAAAA